jgi:hypothetical protein
MFKKPVIQLMIAIALPLASAIFLEQVPKSDVAEVPFAFQVAGETLPAGTYSVQQAGLGGAIRIQNNKLALVGTRCTAAKKKFGRTQPARLIFDRSDGGYRLSEVWLEADGRGLIFGEPAANREIKCVWLR